MRQPGRTARQGEGRDEHDEQFGDAAAGFAPRRLAPGDRGGSRDRHCTIAGRSDRHTSVSRGPGAAALPSPILVPAPEWSFVVAPYFWMAGMAGDVAAFGSPPVHVDVPFTKVLDDLDFAGMAVAEARYGRFSLSSDILYLKLSTDRTTPLGIIANQAQLGAEAFEFTALAGYALIDTPTAQLDIVAGARVWSVEETLSFTGGVLNGLWLQDSASWADAMGGIKGRANLTPKIYLTGWALAGSGGADIDWDVFGGVGYEFNDRISGVLGYRAAGVDYQDGPFLFDVVIQGPVLGAVFRF